jgi:alcohol dehydrogenase
MFVESGDQFTFFLPPYVVFGRGKRSAIPEYAKRLGMTRALLVVDPFFVETDYFTEVQSGLEDVGIKATSWSGVVPDPTDVSVDEAVKVYKDANCDGVICIGGGSAMDTGKSVAVVIGSGSHSIREHTPPTNRSIEGMAPVICIPTTSGTGAEVNPYAMVTNTETGRKEVGYPAWELLAAQRVAIVDPDLTASMPHRLTAITGIDALCQALECYLTRTPNPVSDCLAFRAVHLIAHNLRRAVDNGQDMKARVNMSLAAMLATMAFPNAGLSYPHFLSEPMGDAYHLEHGVAVGSVLVATLEVLLPFRTDRLAEVAMLFDVSSQGRSPRDIAEAGIREIQQLLKDIGFPTLSEATGGADIVDIDALLEDLVDRKPHLVGTPAERERVGCILRRSLEF